MKRHLTVKVLALLMALLFSFVLDPAGARVRAEEKQDSETEAVTDGTEDPTHIAEFIGFEAITVDFPEEPLLEYPVAEGGSFSIFIPLAGVASKYYTSLSESPTVIEWIEDTGITVEFVHPPAGQTSENFTLLATTGDLPDAIVNGNSYYPGGDVAAVNDGVFMDLTDLVEGYMPDYYYFMENNDLFRKMATTADNMVYSVYNYKDVQAPYYMRPQFRSDWLEEAGMEVPVTYDDWEDYFDWVLENQEDVAPFMLDSSGIDSLFVGSFEAGGGGVGRFFQTNGVIRYMFNEPGFEDYLSMMNDWWTRGYIHPDFATTDLSREEALTNGVVAAACSNTDGVFTLARELGVETGTAPYPRVDEDDEYHMDIFYFPQNGTPTSFKADSENIEAAMKFINYGFTRHGSGVANFGVFDDTWTMSEDGIPEFTEEALTQTDIPMSDVEYVLRLHTMWSKYRYGDDISMIRNVAETETWDYRAKWGDDPTSDNAYAIPTLSFSPEAAEEIGDLSADINTYAEEMVLRFITGDAPLSEYDDFVDRLNELGMQRLIELYQEAFDAFLVK